VANQNFAIAPGAIDFYWPRSGRPRRLGAAGGGEAMMPLEQRLVLTVLFIQQSCV
jgi:hypothetical protein